MSSPALLMLLTVSVATAFTCVGAALRPRTSPRTDEPHTEAPTSTARRRRGRGGRALLERSLPDAIELIVLAVRAGHLPLHAIRTSLPYLPEHLRPAFTEVVRRVDDGVRFADALGALTEGLGHPLAPLVDSLAAADRYGLPLAPVLDRLAAEARQQRRRQLDIAARQLPVRLAVPLVLCTLPSFVLLAVVPLLLAAFSSLRS